MAEIVKLEIANICSTLNKIILFLILTSILKPYDCTINLLKRRQNPLRDLNYEQILIKIHIFLSSRTIIGSIRR